MTSKPGADFVTLSDDHRALFDQYQLVDIAVKVVGVGSVGTRCAFALLVARDDDPLFLQFKEARASVLEPYAGCSRYHNHGQRVVEGERLMQSASDEIRRCPSRGTPSRFVRLEISRKRVSAFR